MVETAKQEIPDWVQEGNVPTGEAFTDDVLDLIPDVEVDQDVVLQNQKNVKISIKDVTYKESKNKKIRYAHPTFVLVDGCKHKDKTDAYKNKHIFQDITIWFDREEYSALDKNGKETKAFWMLKGMTPYKTLRAATGSANLGPDIKGKIVLADIKTAKDTWTDKVTGDPKSKTYNYLTNFKAVESAVDGL